jgi:hypothetical protein
MLSQTKPVHSLPSYLLTIILILTSPPLSGLC